MTRTHIVLIATVTMAIVAGLWWLTKDEVGKSRSSENASAPPPALEESPPSVTLTPVAAATPPGKQKGAVMSEVLGTLNHQPIEFYGRVIDQYGTPIPDVKVTGSIIYNSGVAAGVDTRSTVTDQNGLFSFKGMKGRTFDYHLEKLGYESMPEGDAFDYTKLVSEEKRHHPDPKNPVVLKMWKLQGAEPLFYKDETFSLPADGSPVRIDLQAGKIVADGGDLIIAIKHGIQPAGTSILRYDWSAEIMAVEGGLLETDQRITNMHLAPEAGYVPSISLKMLAISHDWTRTYGRSFYLKSRGGRYARVGIDLHTIPTARGSYLDIKSWVNPSGSRNLEYDPSKPASVR